MDELRFAKYHGTGNDFVMVEDLDDAIRLEPSVVAALCDRHRGIGADGMIRITSAADPNAADYFMDYSNADGSVAEMCGNGIRCLAKLVFERGLTDRRELSIETRGGVKRVRMEIDGDRVTSVTVNMGPPAFTRAEIPMLGPSTEPFLLEPFEAGGRTVKATAVSMGNPHLVLFVEEDPDGFPVLDVGPLVERSDLFPEHTNVEFVGLADGELRARVWERGVGETMACGTGACAVLVAANEAGLVPERATVRFPGGALKVERRADGNVELTGPAERTFEGSVDAAWLRDRSENT
ncbi:MAG: diaminopimelate epimerase [Actinomycetota bacterium]|nr:diaminopimelate epimerase [Actinomycetota bacterium]